MKKALKLILICVLLINILSGCGISKESRTLRDIGSELDLDLSGGTLTADMDSHGGFHGDGTAFAAVQFEDSHLAELIKNSDDWSAFPPENTIYALMYGYDFGDMTVTPHLTDEATGEALFPVIENGYYLFRDHQTKGEDHRDDADKFFDRASWNFDLAVYDSDTDTLYYSEFDT